MIFINNQEKIDRLKLNSNNFYVVADFDKTLTEGTSDSTWGVISKVNQVGEEYNERRTALFKKYRPMEIDPNISDEEKSNAMKEWWQLHINLFYEFGIKEQTVKNAIKLGNLKYRDGAKKFLMKMNELNVPVIIISAGIGNVIEEFLKSENDYYDNIKIISNFIVFENGEFKEIYGDIIHSLNKNIVELDDESKQYLKNRDNILLLGDGYADLKMVPEENRENTVTVGFLDEKIEENLELYKKGFDIVLTNKSTLDNVNDILKIY